jgi:hypothetical protein
LFEIPENERQMTTYLELKLIADSEDTIVKMILDELKQQWANVNHETLSEIILENKARMDRVDEMYDILRKIRETPRSKLGNEELLRYNKEIEANLYINQHYPFDNDYVVKIVREYENVSDVAQIETIDNLLGILTDKTANLEPPFAKDLHLVGENKFHMSSHLEAMEQLEIIYKVPENERKMYLAKKLWWFQQSERRLDELDKKFLDENVMFASQGIDFKWEEERDRKRKERIEKLGEFITAIAR